MVIQAADRHPAEIRVLTYNVHSCVGSDRKTDPARIADVIAACRPDIVGLQELDVGRRRTGGVDQAVVIAGLLSMDSHFHPALHIEEEKYGDAILSPFPSRLIKRDALPSIGEPRGALAVEIDALGRRIVVINTHFGLRRREQLLQAQALLGPEWLGHPEIEVHPTILMGDFNAGPRSAPYKLIAERLADAATQGGERARSTYPSRIPLLRIDHVFLSRDLSALETSVMPAHPARTASDHLPLLARILLPD